MQNESKKIAIIGAGNVGAHLASGWTKAGHEIVFGVRDPQSEKAQKLQASHPTASVTTNAEAAHGAQIVVLSMPWDATKAALRDCGSLEGKIVIDVTNPLKVDANGLGLDRGFSTSGGEQVAQWAPGAHVFKTMNQIGAGLMDHPTFASGRPVMFVAGEDHGKEIVLALVNDLDFEAIDVGDLSFSRLIEPLAMLWIHLAVVKKFGPTFSFGLLRQ